MGGEFPVKKSKEGKFAIPFLSWMRMIFGEPSARK
jgi:hypothetical protein